MKNKIKSISSFVTGIIFSTIIFGSGVFAATVISASKVEYTDNTKLGATNVQAAIDGTCTKFDSDLKTMENNIIDTLYPVGSIYISETDTTSETVSNRFKALGKTTTWVAYSAGKTLIGAGTGTYQNGKTASFSPSNNSKNLGEYIHTLTIAEMTLHSHEQYVLSNPGQGSYNSRRDYNGDYEKMERYRQYVHTQPAGGDQPHNNIQPYNTVYMYKRVK